MQDYLTYLISPLLSQPNQLEITSQPGTVSIKVGIDDTGRIIGKHGLVINSLRTLLKTYCHLRELPFVTLTLSAPPKSKTDY